MRENYPTALGWALGHEGGYVNHPRDHGGATNKGVTQAVYSAWRMAAGLAPRDVRNITVDEVCAIYQAQYWNAVRGDDLPAGLDYAVFDYAINSGPARAARALQAAVGVRQDGHIGAITLDAVRRISDVEGLIGSLCAARLAWMRTLSTWEVFGVGWARRIQGDFRGVQSEDVGVIDRASMLARGENAPPPRRDAPHKAEADDLADHIRALQDALRDLGKNPGDSDGVWGVKTRAAVVAILADPPVLY